MTASLMLAYRSHNGILLGVVLVMGTIVIPAGYVMARRKMEKAKQMRTEDLLMLHTRAYLQNLEPLREKAESDIQIWARSIDGCKLPTQDFWWFHMDAAAPPQGEPVVFDALPRRYAIRGLCDRRFADLKAAMPEPVCTPLSELLPAPAAQEFGFWNAGARKLNIQYSNAVMDEIRIRAEEGCQRNANGGVEVGGVLFGTHHDGALRILAVRPVECEYANGPRFMLSKADENGLAELLLASSDDPALAGLQPAGYYPSHLHEEICLSGADVRLFNRFFPQPWQVALVVRPGDSEPVRAGFFFREGGRAIRSESSYCEFPLAPAPAV
jgi:hypothetical protein